MFCLQKQKNPDLRKESRGKRSWPVDHVSPSFPRRCWKDCDAGRSPGLSNCLTSSHSTESGTVTFTCQQWMPNNRGIGFTVAGQLPIYTEFPVAFNAPHRHRLW